MDHCNPAGHGCRLLPRRELRPGRRHLFSHRHSDTDSNILPARLARCNARYRRGRLGTHPRGEEEFAIRIYLRGSRHADGISNCISALRGVELAHLLCRVLAHPRRGVGHGLLHAPLCGGVPCDDDCVDLQDRGRSLGFVCISSPGPPPLTFSVQADADVAKDLTVSTAYRQLASLFTLPGIKHYLVVGMLFKLGFVANESIFMLELVDRGFRREQLAFAAVIDFPSQVLIGLVTLNFSKNLKPWLFGQGVRLWLALLSIVLVWQYKPERVYLFPLVVTLHVAITFASTCMFVSSGAFFNRISDPAIGGMYITFLNTVSNVGGTWPKWFVFSAVDMATVAYCKRPSSMFWDETMPCRHVSDCASGSVCETIVDGYYIVAAVSFLLGVMILAFVVLPKTAIMESLPLSSWRIPKHLYS
eukprot:m.390390 g.390390  ORF g.390390 m.390390 type:complete len:417 (+) comp56342_c0_seq7:396-1646(+)